MTLALLDGDEAIYKACVTRVSYTDWETDEVVDRLPTLQEAKDKFISITLGWADDAGCAESLVCLSPPERSLFRRGIYDEYKSKRSEKPEHFTNLERWVTKKFQPKWIPGLEADDVMGILSGPDTVICSNDKDMKTIPGQLYITGKQKLVTITETRADWQWMYQTLMGDSTDGFNGCLGCGEKGATDLLEDCGPSLERMVQAAVARYLEPKKGKYKAVTQTLADFRRMAALARILRPSDYNQETGDVRYALPGLKDITFNAREFAK